MSDDIQDLDNLEVDDAAQLAAAELEALQNRARLLNIQFHPKIGADKLREKIAAALAGEESNNTDEDADSVPEGESENQRRMRLKKEAMALVRIRLTCMNPLKKEWEGEFISTGNNATGTIKRYIPFNAEDGWHVEKMILEQLRERQCTTFYTEKDDKGRKIRKAKLIREFAIEVLPPLTEKELKDLAQRQAMARGQ